jgi:hypothetical protein
MTFKFPAGVLAQHTAVLGKTGSGKTTTAKLMVEQVVAEEARVCVLDPIKSDWWGLTSSADGKRAGLPFQILGGPRGHVPLHSSSGKAIGEIVANGALPLSIIDMADFEPGGQAKFFVDFAPTLIRKMRGVVYLVMEEAHLFAPKERSGIGAENMSIHWAKTMATAGRSKGISLILVTQRTQALHNALLGSCETMIAHRMSAPADQEPVVKWLKANTDKVTPEKVASSLSSIPTGSGWLCSGEEKLFELVKFPRIRTYDNSATPTGDAASDQVKTAPVDPEKLRAIIGEAVKTAEANDPAVLKKRIAELERLAAAKPTAVPVNPDAIERATKEGYDAGKEGALKAAHSAWNALLATMRLRYENAGQEIFRGAELEVSVPARIHTPRPLTNAPLGKAPAPVKRPAPIPSSRDPGVSRPQQVILDRLAWAESKGLYPAPKKTLAAVSGVSPSSSSYENNLGALRTAGLIDYPLPAHVGFTDAGRAAAGVSHDDGRQVHEQWFEIVSRPQRAILEALVQAHPDPLTKELLAETVGVSAGSSSYENNLGALRSLGAVDYPAPKQVGLTRYVMP